MNDKNELDTRTGKDLVTGKFLPGHTYGRPRAWSDAEIEEEANSLIEHAQNPDTYTLSDHYAKRGYTYDEVFDWVKVHVPFSKAVKFAKQLIGARREREGLKGKLDSAIVRSTMANYDPEHRQMLREQAQKIDVSSNKDGISVSVVSYEGVKGE